MRFTLSCVGLEVILLVTLLTCGQAVRSDYNESTASSVDSVPCIVSDCGRIGAGRPHPGGVDRRYHLDTDLCVGAYREALGCSKRWLHLLRVADPGECSGLGDQSKHASFVGSAEVGTCESTANVNMMTRMFDDGGCVENDLCSFAMARLSALSLACRDGSRLACHSDRVSALIQSLKCPCSNIVSGASRSHAIIQRTSDGLYIVKGIKDSEMPVLQNLVHRMPHGTLLNGWAYTLPARRLVIMPNAYHGATYGLHVSWVNRGQPDFERCSSSLLGRIKMTLRQGYDIKPLPIKSSQRKFVFGHLVRRQWKLQDMAGWAEVTSKFLSSLWFLDHENLVDYSLLVALFEADVPDDAQCSPYIELSSESRQCLVTADCAAGAHASAIQIQMPPSRGSSRPTGGEFHDESLPGYNDQLFDNSPMEREPFFYRNTSSSFADMSMARQGKCEAICVAVIDYLMKFSLVRKLENALPWKQFRWSDYAKKTEQMWHCLGDLTQRGCEEYLQLGCEELADSTAVSNSRWCAGISLEEQVDGNELIDHVPDDGLPHENSGDRLQDEDFSSHEQSFPFEQDVGAAQLVNAADEHEYGDYGSPESPFPMDDAVW